MARTDFPSISTEAKVYTVAIDSDSTLICVQNTEISGWIIKNIGSVPVYIKYGPYCNPVLYTQRITPNAIFCDNYGGLITGCADLRSVSMVLVTLKL
jgi:hypothetical protein